MNNANAIKVLLVESDPAVSSEAQAVLRQRGYEVFQEPEAAGALERMQAGFFHLALAGDTRDGMAPLELMRRMVMQSPMTALILMTDIPDEELHDKAEGYGVIGNVTRGVPAADLEQLLDRFEAIHAATQPGG